MQMFRQTLDHMPTPVHAFQSAEEFRLPAHPRQTVIDNGEKLRLQLFSLNTGINFSA